MEHKKYETFEHTADIGIRGFGYTVEEAFENTAFGMFSIMYRRIDRVKPERAVKIKAEAYDLESLFVEWLNSLLSKSDVEEMVFCRFKVKLDLNKNKLEGMAWGEKRRGEFEPSIEVKAATYSELKVEKRENIYMAQCVLDI